jgi:hypothetical protein
LLASFGALLISLPPISTNSSAKAETLFDISFSCDGEAKIVEASIALWGRGGGLRIVDVVGEGRSLVGFDDEEEGRTKAVGLGCAGIAFARD